MDGDLRIGPAGRVDVGGCRVPLMHEGVQDVYILGSANVGKSTLVNRLIQRDFSLEEAPWKEERRIKGKILGDVEAEEALRDQLFAGGEEQAAAGSRKISGGVDMGPDGKEWQTFHIEGGLDLGDLDEDELMDSEEAWVESVEEGVQGAVGEEGGDGKADQARAGWETFEIEV